MKTPSNDEKSYSVCLNGLNNSVKSFIGLRGSKGCSLATLWEGVLDSKAPDTCLYRFVWQSCLRLHGHLLHVVDFKEPHSAKRMKTVQHDLCYKVWEEEKLTEALNTLEINLPNIEEAKLIGLIPFKTSYHRELGLYPEVNLKTLDVQALEVIAIANEAGATVFDVSETLKGYYDTTSGSEGGTNYRRLLDPRNIHFIISKLLSRKLITRIHGEKSNMNFYCLTRFAKEFMRDNVKINKRFWRDEVMPLFGSSSNLSISLEELRSRLKLSSSLIPAIKDALVNKETGQPIALKLSRPRDGARYHYIKWYPEEAGLPSTEDCSEAVTDVKKTTKDEEVMVEYSQARQFLALVSSKGEAGYPASELALSVSAEHKMVQNVIRRLVSSGQMGIIFRQQGRQRTSYHVAVKYLNGPQRPPEFPLHTPTSAKSTLPCKSEVVEEAAEASFTTENKRKKSHISPVSTSPPTEILNSSLSETAASLGVIASASTTEPPVVLFNEKTAIRKQQYHLPITQERQNRHTYLLEIVQRERIVTACEAAQEIRLKEKNSGIMSSAGFMDTRSFKRILNSVLSDSTVGVETITLDVPQMNISGKGQESKKELVLKLISVALDEVQQWISKRELANEEKRNELLKNREAKANKDKINRGGKALVSRRPNYRGSSKISWRGFMDAHMLRTKLLHKFIWRSVTSLEEHRESYDVNHLVDVDLGEILSLLPLRVFCQAFGYPPQFWRPQRGVGRLMKMVEDCANTPLHSLPKELQYFFQHPWYNDSLLKSVNILETLGILVKRNVDDSNEKQHDVASISSSSIISVMSHLELGYYQLRNDIKIPLEVEVSSISELPFCIQRWKDGETFYRMLHICGVNTQREGCNGFQLSKDLMALVPELGHATAWEERTPLPLRRWPEIPEHESALTVCELDKNLGGLRRDKPPCLPDVLNTMPQRTPRESSVTYGLLSPEQAFEIEGSPMEEPVVGEIEEQDGLDQNGRGEDGSSHSVQPPEEEMSENLPLAVSQYHHLRFGTQKKQTKGSKSHGRRKGKRKHTTARMDPSSDLPITERSFRIGSEGQSLKQQPFVDDHSMNRNREDLKLEESFQLEWRVKPLNSAALLGIKQAIIALSLSPPNASYAVKLSLSRFSSEDVERVLWYLREVTELGMVEDGRPCTPNVVEQESKRLMMGTVGPSPYLRLSRVALSLLSRPEKHEDKVPGFPYPTTFLAGIKDSSEMFHRSAIEYNSMLFENGENVNAEAVDASSALGITSYSTPSNLAVFLGLNAVGCLSTQSDISPHSDHDITLERGKTPVLQLSNFAVHVCPTEYGASEDIADDTLLDMVDSDNPHLHDEMFHSVLDRVNEKKEKGISLIEAGGVAVLPMLCNLCHMKKVISVPCPSGLRWVSKQYWGEWVTRKYSTKVLQPQHRKRKCKDRIKSHHENQQVDEEDAAVNTADELNFTDDLVPTRIWIGIDGSILEHVLSKLKHWVVGKLLQCPGCSVKNLATCIPLVTLTEVVELMRDMELAGIVNHCGYGPETGLGSPIWEKTCFSLTPRGLEHFKQ